MTIAELLRQEDREEGIQKGIRETKVHTAIAMLSRRYNIALIADITELSYDEIVNLQVILKPQG